MPCYSRVTITQITDVTRLLKALAQAGVKVSGNNNELRVSTAIGTFSRAKTGTSFSFDGTQEQMSSVGRKYAEITTREWAVKNGLSVVGSSENKLVFLRR